MSETVIVEEVNIEKPKKKYYTEAQIRAIKKYREKKGTYTQTQKDCIYRYNAKIKEYAKKYKELMKNGLIPEEKQNSI